jgi:hypothetical protein
MELERKETNFIKKGDVFLYATNGLVMASPSALGFLASFTYYDLHLFPRTEFKLQQILGAQFDCTVFFLVPHRPHNQGLTVKKKKGKRPKKIMKYYNRLRLPADN